MVEMLYVDDEICVAVKPAGVDAQAAKRFAPDMVSELRKYLVINKLCTAGREPYVGVIHRLDKPVSGIMVYARTKNAAARLSAQLQDGGMKKTYRAVVCGKPSKTVDNFVDYLKKDVDGNFSRVVDKGTKNARRAELSCLFVSARETKDGVYSLVEIGLKTGRHHQIRVQMASRGLPIAGDQKYCPEGGGDGGQLALCACGLEFSHPSTGERMRFSIEPAAGVFEMFSTRNKQEESDHTM